MSRSLLREEWKNGGDTLLMSDIVWFNDGSKKKEDTGAGIPLNITLKHTLKHGIPFFITTGKNPTIFQAGLTRNTADEICG